MSLDRTERTRSRCLNCGFEAETGGEAWNAVEAPPFDRVTQCPDCDSTDVTTGL